VGKAGAWLIWSALWLAVQLFRISVQQLGSTCRAGMGFYGTANR
jgi:hypothetical protein